MKEGVLTEFVRMLRADGRHSSVREGAALPGSVSSTSCAARAQLLHLRPDSDSELSCTKRSNKRVAAALKSCKVSSAGGGSHASGGEWIMLRWECGSAYVSAACEGGL